MIAGIAITGAFIIAATYLWGDGIWPHDYEKPTLSWHPEMSEADWEQAQMSERREPQYGDRRYAFRDIITSIPILISGSHPHSDEFDDHS